jgi:hypothetical protein
MKNFTIIGASLAKIQMRENILKNSGFFNNITNFADPQQFQAIEIDYSQPAGSSHADDFNNLNIQYQNAFNDLMNTVGNLQ